MPFSSRHIMEHTCKHIYLQYPEYSITAIIIQGITFYPDCVAQLESLALAIYHRLNYCNHIIHACAWYICLGKLIFYQALSVEQHRVLYFYPHAHKLSTSKSLSYYPHFGGTQHFVFIGRSVGAIWIAGCLDNLVPRSIYQRFRTVDLHCFPEV